MDETLRIVFMGTPQFAATSLEAILKSKHKVAAVVTAPDRPAGRGLKLQLSEVKEYALNNNLPVLQPEKLKDGGFIGALKTLNPDLIVVVAFRMLPEVIWSLPRYGTINLHASLLPQYRGAAPINWAIINGEKETGVTTFYINQAIDTGDILFSERVPIFENDTAGTLHDKLMSEGAKLLVKTIDAIADKLVLPSLQSNFQAGDLKAAPKIFRDDCRINWNIGYSKVYDFVRGLSPYPGAWTELEGSETGKKFTLKIFQVHKLPDIVLEPGKVLITDKMNIYIGCRDGSIEVMELQPEGRKPMKAPDFLRGHPHFKGIVAKN